MLLILYFVFLFLFFYLTFIKPNKKRNKQLNEMINSLKIGDVIVTNSGIIAKIVAIDIENNEIEIRSANSTLKVEKNSIMKKR